GKDNARNYLKEHPAAAAEIEKAIREAAFSTPDFAPSAVEESDVEDDEV
ncbi:MAG: DNA recombination/repair protein RecA, partial [Thiothrix litoralis]